jgi:hypothetical protein
MKTDFSMWDPSTELTFVLLNVHICSVSPDSNASDIRFGSKPELMRSGMGDCRGGSSVENMDK